MEMKENIYPRLQTVPPIEDQVQGVSTAKNKRNSRSISRAARMVDNVDTVLIAITLGGGACC